MASPVICIWILITCMLKLFSFMTCPSGSCFGCSSERSCRDQTKASGRKRQDQSQCWEGKRRHFYTYNLSNLDITTVVQTRFVILTFHICKAFCFKEEMHFETCRCYFPVGKKSEVCLFWIFVPLGTQMWEMIILQSWPYVIAFVLETL